MKKTKFIFTLMLGCSIATMAKAADTSYDNCVAAVGAANAANCVQIGTSGTYYALSGDAGNKTMTIYGTNADGTAATVSENAFINAKSWKSTFPEGVTSLKTSGNVDIGECAFWGATGLTSIDLTGVKTIGDGAFSYATGLTSANLTGVQTIGMSAFYGATGLTSANLTGVQTIGESAFEEATSLTSVDLTGVQSIEGYAFFGATGLTSANLTGVQTIGEYAFWGATGLTSIVISDLLLDSNGNITGIAPDAFEESGLSTIYCPTDRTCGNNFGISGDNIISYSKNEDGTFTVGDNTYANAYMMTKNITCEGEAQCAALRTALNAGSTCSTQDACNTLAAEYATPQPSQPTKPQRADIRIYTIDEANAVAGTKNRVSIKYR